jgi:hypothetical protein
MSDTTLTHSLGVTLIITPARYFNHIHLLTMRNTRMQYFNLNMGHSLKQGAHSK